MRRNPLHTSRTYLRFQRWSRNRYAAFCSIGREVVIRRVKNSIANASLSKQLHLPIVTPDICLFKTNEYDPDDGEASLLILIAEIFFTTIIPATSKEAAATYHTFSHKKGASSIQILSVEDASFFIH